MRDYKQQNPLRPCPQGLQQISPGQGNASLARIAIRAAKKPPFRPRPACRYQRLASPGFYVPMVVFLHPV
jgi:hypothetical protein